MPAAKPKTLAELLESPDVGLPETTYKLCLSAKLAAEFDRIDAAITDALDEERTSAKRLGSKSTVMKLNEQREALRAKMAEHQVEVRLRAKPVHDWRRWVNAHPSREDNDLDDRLGYNADALQESVPEYVVDVNGAELANGEWDKLAAVAAPGDLWRLAALVRGLHETGAAVPKSSTSWLKSQLSDDDSK